MKELFTHADTVHAIKHWLDFGEQSIGTAQQGYFSGDGWAARVLRAHLEALAARPEGREPQWIARSDRVPDDKQVVLVAGKHALNSTAMYQDGQWWAWSEMHEDWSANLGDLVTHWMPRPSLPQQQRQEDK